MALHLQDQIGDNYDVPPVRRAFLSITTVMVELLRFPGASMQVNGIDQCAVNVEDSLASYPKVRQMIHFGSYKKRDLQGSIRRNIYAWMSSGKNVASIAFKVP